MSRSDKNIFLIDHRLENDPSLNILMHSNIFSLLFCQDSGQRLLPACVQLLSIGSRIRDVLASSELINTAVLTITTANYPTELKRTAYLIILQYKLTQVSPHCSIFSFVPLIHCALNLLLLFGYNLFNRVTMQLISRLKSYMPDSQIS